MTLEAPPSQRRRTRARIAGTVQGVGFRPHVHRLAHQLGLGGFVLNDSRGVLLEVEGDSPGVEEFLARLGPEAPPLAVVERVLVEDREPTGELAFAIRASDRHGVADAAVAPDGATCEECLRELADPSDRRFRYPFINCTNCGPRFTIVRGVPYDRPLTTMAGFEMCASCRAEYDNPGDRRFHAQPNACPECGPSVSLLGGADAELDAAELDGLDPIGTAAATLADGAIVAIKGIGGYHLACRADDERSVATLRSRKHREDKPFALMALSLAVAESLVRLDAAERDAIAGPARPIVLAGRRRGAPVADSVAPGAGELGVMLPYSPLHHLLLRDFAALAGEERATLVLTSGNVSDEPIAYLDDEARARLSRITDLFLVHDRPIETRTDDSVLRVVGAADGPRHLLLRRSRGYVPGVVTLPEGTSRPLLACGAELKSTFCLARGDRAWVSHHIGDLENYETLRSFSDGIAHFERLFDVAPEVVAHDLHPGYLSTAHALERADREELELVGVQHHHAHLAACLAEHGEPGPAVGAIFDGTGYGSDGTVWGGEILFGDCAGFRRSGMLLPTRLPGGARAIREPWRMACAWLTAVAAGSDAGDATLPPGLAAAVEEDRWRKVLELIRTGLQSPMTTSMGRLFDAVGALCGLRASVNYEGQAAIELEAICDPFERGRYPIELVPPVDGAPLVIDPRTTIGAVASELADGVSPAIVASRFHAAVAHATVVACSRVAAVEGVELVVLCGGVFQNRRLLEATLAGLGERGLRALTPQRLPVNDGAISYGQAAVAARRIEA